MQSIEPFPYFLSNPSFRARCLEREISSSRKKNLTLVAYSIHVDRAKAQDQPLRRRRRDNNIIQAGKVQQLPAPCRRRQRRIHPDRSVDQSMERATLLPTLLGDLGEEENSSRLAAERGVLDGPQEQSNGDSGW